MALLFQYEETRLDVIKFRIKIPESIQQIGAVLLPQNYRLLIKEFIMIIITIIIIGYCYYIQSFVVTRIIPKNYRSRFVSQRMMPVPRVPHDTSYFC